MEAAIQHMPTNLAAIVPLLPLGRLADLIGIPAVIALLALAILALWLAILRDAGALAQGPAAPRGGAGLGKRLAWSKETMWRSG